MLIGIGPDIVRFKSGFTELAGRLLNTVEFHVVGRAYRLAEIEIYYWGEGHRDPFAHHHPVEAEFGRWYFHRVYGGYRSGSFKGLDMTFGDGAARVGALIRSLVGPDGVLIDGPSLVVDHLLARTGEADPAALDRAIGPRLIGDESSPLVMRVATAKRTHTVYRTARVGLSLKTARGRPDLPLYLMRPYRFLTEPKAIGKGRPHLVLALHQQRQALADIVRITGIASRVVERYIADFEEGMAEPDFARYLGRDLTTGELCRLMGAWRAHFGGAP